MTPGRRAAFAAGVAAAGLFIPLFVPLGQGKVFAIGDLADFHLPLRHIYQSALVDGQSLLWTSRLFGGFYVHAEGQVGAFHPLHLLLYRLLPLGIAFNLELIASYVFGFAGMWLFLRRLGLATAASLTGAIAFAFSGFNLLHLLHMNAVAVIAHVPWLLLALEVLLFGDTKPKRLALAGIAALTASTVLLGYPQYVWMAAMMCGIWLLVNLRRISRWNLGLAAAAGVAGLMLGGIQLLPSVDLLQESVRQEVSTAFALTYSLHPLNLVQLLSPYFLLERVYSPADEPFVHEFGVYNGALCTIAVVWVLARWRHLASRQAALFGLTLLVAGVILALGAYGIAYEALVNLPIVGSFRAPARHILIAHVGLAVLAAITVDDLQRIARALVRSPVVWAWLPLGLAGAAIAFAWYWLDGGSGFEGHAFDRLGIAGGALFLTATAALVSIAARGRAWGLPLIPLVLALDLGLWGYPYVWEGGIMHGAEIAEREPAPPADAGARVHDGRRNPWPNALLLRGFDVARPYVGLSPAHAMPLSTSRELRVAGVEWVRTEDGWERVPDPMPRVRLVPEAVAAADPVQALATVDVRRVALVERDIPGLASTGKATLVEDAAGRIMMDVASPGRTLLATTEAWHAGWKAVAADGRELRTVRVYGDCLGIVLEPGQYRVSLIFAPWSFTAGVYLSIAGALLTLGLVVLAGRPNRRLNPQ